MTHDEKLDELRAELARQDEAFEAVRAALAGARAGELAVPTTFLEDLAATCDVDTVPSAHAGAPEIPSFALRA